MEKLLEMLKVHEGYRKYPYEDTEGYTTIGYGWNLEANGLPQDILEELLEDKLWGLRVYLKQYEWYRSLSDNRQSVLVDMAYNLGVNGLLSFEKMIEAIKNEDYEKAAKEMLDSLWAKQVGKRAKDLAEMMKTDKPFKEVM